jgi:hypothetical protein
MEKASPSAGLFAYQARHNAFILVLQLYLCAKARS